MGIDGLSGQDYVTRFNRNTEADVRRAEEIGNAATTVPIGRSDTTQLPSVNYETGWIKYTQRAYKPEDVRQDINFEDGNNQLKAQTLYTYRDGKKNKDAINAAVDEVTQRFIEYGTANGKTVDEKEAKKLAKRFVENEMNKENFLSTRTYVDEAEYKKAEQERNNRKKELASQYMHEDPSLSKKDAERKADANLVRNQYLKNKGAREYIEAHKDYFYDDDGNFSQEKYKAFVKGLMNAHTGEDEVDNYHLSLNERYDLAGKFGINDNSMCDMVHRAGGGFAKDYKELKQAIITLVGAGVGMGIGAFISSTATAAASAAAGAGNAASGSVAVAEAFAEVSVNQAVAGAAIGGAAASQIPTKTRGEGPAVYAPGKKPQDDLPVQPEPQPEPTPVVTEPEPCTLEPDEAIEETCVYKLKRGQSLYDAVRDGYGLTNHKDIMRFVHAIKDRYGIDYRDNTPRTEWEMPEIEGRKFNCDAKVKGSVRRYAKKQGGGFGSFTRNDTYWYTDCNNNMSTIYTNRADRDAAMAKRQAELNAR